MAKEICPNCATKLSEPSSFCPTCDRPTRHANDAERLDWDLRQWRAHVDKSVAAGVVPGAQALRASGGVIVAFPEKPLAPVVRPSMIQPRTQQIVERVAESRVAEAPVAAAPAPEAPKVSQKEPRRSRAHVAKSRLPKMKREPKRAEVVDDVDPDNAFAYRACSTCQETDWIVRTKRNEDETWNYWCVRCSRSFKTDVKLSQAVKPFLFSGAVVGGLAAASILMLR
jgi:hypothetical protein